MTKIKGIILMRVTVNFFTSLREITGKKEEEIESPRGITVEEALGHLSKKHGHQFRNYVYDENGKVRSHLLFMVNGESITTLQGFKTKLRDGDKVVILTPVGGG